ncbi:hypothetical protein BDV23DRAFT_33573 [Aspergillus alliaceus]|uniref:Copper transporter n=1 Tax=Petromyces alliaceus TaxID=209559 RepID=A0A5N7CJL6_PETAA|nr:hypothetical protein BDV23DRAFT_33573 [Aspergillus alliaceus]
MMLLLLLFTFSLLGYWRRFVFQYGTEEITLGQQTAELRKFSSNDKREKETNWGQLCSVFMCSLFPYESILYCYCLFYSLAPAFSECRR